MTTKDTMNSVLIAGVGLFIHTDMTYELKGRKYKARAIKVQQNLLNKTEEDPLEFK